MRTVLITIITLLSVNCACANWTLVSDACAPVGITACDPVEATACDPVGITACDPAVVDACAPAYGCAPFTYGYAFSAPPQVILAQPQVIVRQPRVRIERKITIERKVREVERINPVIIQQKTILRCD